MTDQKGSFIFVYVIEMLLQLLADVASSFLEGPLRLGWFSGHSDVTELLYSSLRSCFLLKLFPSLTHCGEKVVVEVVKCKTPWAVHLNYGVCKSWPWSINIRSLYQSAAKSTCDVSLTLTGNGVSFRKSASGIRPEKENLKGTQWWVVCYSWVIWINTQFTD